MLNTSGLLALVKSTLFAIPVHVSISCCLSAWAIGEIDHRRRAFLWCGSDRANRGKCKVAWPVAYAPKCYGGLGIPDLKTLGYALRLRWEWLRRTQPDSTWAALPHKTEKNIMAMFRASVTMAVGDGASALFWTDSWLPSRPLSESAPNLRHPQEWPGAHGEGRHVPTSMGARHLWHTDHEGHLRIPYPLGNAGRRRPVAYGR